MAIGGCDGTDGDLRAGVSRGVSVAATDSYSLWRRADPVRCDVNPYSVYWSLDVIETIGSLLGTARKLTPVTLFGLAVACAIILFTPTNALTKLGLRDFRDSNRSTVALVLLICGSLLFAHLVFRAGPSLRTWLATKRTRRIRERDLRELTPIERAYLMPFVERAEATRSFAFNDGVAVSLVHKEILYTPGKYTISRSGTPHIMQPWARRHLRSHPELLEGARGEPADPAKLYDEL